MNSISNFLRQVGYRFSVSMRRFMQGRYGVDKLNLTILGCGLIVSILSSLVPWILLSVLFSLLSYGLMIWAIFRCFSKNTYARYEENRRYQMLLGQLKDREHRYFHCPHCSQMTRVPKGKGKINITCPRCGEKFQRKS